MYYFLDCFLHRLWVGCFSVYVHNVSRNWPYMDYFFFVFAYRCG